jgi:hypothetical protein
MNFEKTMLYENGRAVGTGIKLEFDNGNVRYGKIYDAVRKIDGKVGLCRLWLGLSRPVDFGEFTEYKKGEDNTWLRTGPLASTAHSEMYFSRDVESKAFERLSRQSFLEKVITKTNLKYNDLKDSIFAKKK